MTGGGLLQAGVGKATLWGIWQTDRVLADGLEVRVLVFRQGGCTAALAVADVGWIWPSSALRLRKAIAATLGVPPACVGVFATQNHAAPMIGDPDGPDTPKVVAACCGAARQALDSLQPVEMAQVQARPERPLVFCRRMPFGDLGAFTFYYGYRIDAETGKADVSHHLKLALASLAAGKLEPLRCYQMPVQGVGAIPEPPQPVPTPAWLPAAQDDLVQGLFFRTPAGQPVASLLRFAAHPATSNLLGANYWSGDYPLYARRRAEERFGGTALFLTGPCGDQCPPIARKSLALAEEVGRRVADCALEALPGAAWRPVDRLAVSSPEVRLRLRADSPPSKDAARTEQHDLARRIRLAAQARAPLATIKKMLERHEVLSYITTGAYTAWTGLTVEGGAGREITHPLFVLRLGATVVAGLPGEPFGRYSARLREETLGNALVVVEEANGYLSYFPTAAEYAHGSYGPCAAVMAPESEETLIRTMKRAIGAI